FRDRRDQPDADLRDRLDDPGALRAVAERLPQLDEALRQRIGRYRHAGPHGIEELVAGDDGAAGFRQVEQDRHGPRREPLDIAGSRYPREVRLDQPVTDPEIRSRRISALQWSPPGKDASSRRLREVYRRGARSALVSRSCRSPTRVVRRSGFHPDRRADRPLQQSLVHGSRWRRIMTKALPLVLTAILAVSPALADARPPPVGERWRPSSTVEVLDRVTLRIHWHESLAALR